MDKKRKLNMDELEQVNGGYVYKADDVPGLPWEILDDATGETIQRFTSYEEAVKAAKLEGVSEKELNKKEVDKLRSNPQY